MGGLSLPQLVGVLPLLVVGLAGTVTALGGRDADSAFLYRQQNPPRIQKAEVERVVRTAIDPLAEPRMPGGRARCRPTTRRGLRNPWRCSRVRVLPDGSYAGRYLGGSSTVEGCCVKVSRAE
jgi:hypothetical protein